MTRETMDFADLMNNGYDYDYRVKIDGDPITNPNLLNTKP